MTKHPYIGHRVDVDLAFAFHANHEIKKGCSFDHGLAKDAQVAKGQLEAAFKQMVYDG